MSGWDGVFYEDLITALATSDHKDFFREVKLKESEVGRRILSLAPEDQCTFVILSLGWLDVRNEIASEAVKNDEEQPFDYREAMAVRFSVVALMRRKLPFDHEQVITLLDWSLHQPVHFTSTESQVTKVIKDYSNGNPLSPEIIERVERFIEVLESRYTYDGAARRKRLAKLREVAGMTEDRIPLVAGEAWSDVAIGEIESSGEEIRSAWIELLNLCAAATGSKPSDGWSKSVKTPIERIGSSAFEAAILGWFPLVDRPRTQRLERTNEWSPDPNGLIDEKNADVLKGLVWLCAGREEAEIPRALTALALSAYRKVPQIGPRCVRVGNACVRVLGEMPGKVAIGQLALLKVRVKFGTARKGIEKSLDAAAEREGLPREEIEEMSVPDYGLEEVGLGRETFGEFTAELVVTGTSSTEIRWIKSDGKRQKSVPKQVREEFAEELKELRGRTKDIQKLLPAQRDRIESFYLEGKSRAYPVWRERYLDHRLVGTLARRLIWTFSNGDRREAGIWDEGRIVDRHGESLDWLGENTQVRLWHPIGESTDEVLAWRDRLGEMEVRQPFKQAHREVYLLTDAERRTRTYSNRFAAHILKQHQFNALCAARGWNNRLRLMVDDFYPPASRPMFAHGLRAEYWIESIGDDFGIDTTESGTHLYVATDQVRFYPEDAPENYAHASGGGYSGPARRRWFGRLDHSPEEALALDEVPPLVFSEVMRDADLFVGVASVGNDPTWDDGGPEGRFRDYWTSYSFGDLSETAKTRRAVLEKLVPRLKISDRCDFEDRFLTVRGDLRTYRIHLGSGNILMQPDDQYLCIVPSQGDRLTDKVYLPFEGDRTMAVILSKAFLLADDGQIEDSTILSQIRPRT